MVVRRIPSAKMPSTRFAYSDRYNYSGSERSGGGGGGGVVAVGSGITSEGDNNSAVVVGNSPRGQGPGRRQPSVGLVGSGSGGGGGIGGIATPRGVQVSSEEREAILRAVRGEDDDEHVEKTFSRLLVDNILSKYNWYWPRRNIPNGPQLTIAWKYYEEVTLPRRIVRSSTTDATVSFADNIMRKAEPGEDSINTELYNPLRLPQSSLIEWGIGMDLYFISLRFFSIVMLLLGILNIFSINFYASEEYNGNSDLDIPGPLRQLVLSTSAVCTNTQWVVCSDCIDTHWEKDPTRFAYYNNVDESSSSNPITLVKRNLCSGSVEVNGWASYLTMLIVCILVGIFSYYLQLREIRFDEDKVTTTDYSIMVKNPPPDALDANEWKSFFNQFATGGDQVTAITIALNNEELISKLVTRRIFREELRAKLPLGTNIDDDDIMEVAVDEYLKEESKTEIGCTMKLLNCTIIPILNVFGMFLPVDRLKARVGTLYDEIEELQNKTYEVSKVFVTFETEEGQRAALDALKVGQINLMMNNTNSVSSTCLFNGKVLHVVEPGEPNTIRWLDLSTSIIKRIIRQIITLGITVGCITVASLAIQQTRQQFGPFYSGMLTTGFNSTIPQIIKILMIIEPHLTESDFQASLYIKITLFRWVLSAILTQIITPHTATLGNLTTDLLPTIYGILLSEIWLAPLIKLSDFMGNLKKHFIAPRAGTQAEMNSWFQGTYYHLGERYTDFTKVLFVVFFYSALFPIGYFFGFLILAFQYYSDKYCLVRIWSWSPLIGSEISIYSRRYFFAGATIAFAYVSSLVWAQFPYDNLCDPLDGTEIPVKTGEYVGVRDLAGDLVDGTGIVVIEQSTNSVQCLQNWRDYVGFLFPAAPRYQTDSRSWTALPDETDLQWMDEEQTNLTLVYGWTATLIGFIILAGIFGRSMYLWLKSIFVGVWEPDGDEQHIDFSSNPDIFAYVPQIKRIGQPFPFLICDIDDIDQNLIGWNDPLRSYDYYNLIYDIPHKSLRRKKIIEGNTRDVTTIADHDDYETRDSVRPAATRGKSHRPIYSIVAHYPTKWQLELMAKEEAEEKRKRS